ncbi:MAG TPA: 16S rRNA (cytidine(1402)-2'-O)-methyltransferase [Actinomycetota bacterium]|jgi:16S rRNA (cytidine1402-2'-O)-methyltransferase|nr:16S rRNA (cytidine(1402)-2'-O)-methyltransferase [Actinomycetota bacterium]
MSGRLFLVGTPIGNLGDMTERAKETLAGVDVVAAEDTRRTGRLLSRFGIKRPLVSLFKGNEARRTAELLSGLREGKDVALVTDAGMPLISDPGHRLVRACVDDGIDVRVVPGPSAVTAALAVSGLPSDRFVFEGFLPRKAGDRRERLRSLADERRTIVVFESPVRLERLLRDVLEEVGDRRVAVARELTKLHEEVVRGRASEVLARVAGSEPKGEVVVVIEGRAWGNDVALAELVGEARRLVDEGMRKREAASSVAKRHDASANAIYEELIRPGS